MAGDFAGFIDRLYLREVAKQCADANHHYSSIVALAAALADAPDEVRRSREGLELLQALVQGQGMLLAAEKADLEIELIAAARLKLAQLATAWDAFRRERKEERAHGTPPDRAEKEAAVFRHVHAMLLHAANVVKIAYPSTNVRARCDESEAQLRARRLRLRERGRRIRQALDFGTVKGLERLKDKAIRDHLEHFDERLDAWTNSLDEAAIALYVAESVGSVEGLFGDSGPGAVPPGFMRHLDANSLGFYCLGSMVDLRLLHDVVAEVGGRAAALVGDWHGMAVLMRSEVLEEEDPS